MAIDEGGISIWQKSMKLWERMRSPREHVAVRRDLRLTDMSGEKLVKEIKGCGQKQEEQQKSEVDETKAGGSFGQRLTV